MRLFTWLFFFRSKRERWKALEEDRATRRITKNMEEIAREFNTRGMRWGS